MTATCEGCAAAGRFLADTLALGYLDDAGDPNSLHQLLREAFHGRGTYGVWIRIDAIVRELLAFGPGERGAVASRSRLAQYLSENTTAASPLTGPRSGTIPARMSYFRTSDPRRRRDPA